MRARVLRPVDLPVRLLPGDAVVVAENGEVRLVRRIELPPEQRAHLIRSGALIVERAGAPAA